MGMVKNYCRFVNGFFKIVTPLTWLKNKDTNFEWTPDCENCFREFKNWLLTASVLTLLSGSGGYAVYTDASGKGLGCLLMQHHTIIAYGLKQLKSHEQNYPTHNFELATIVHALKIWYHYLYEEILEIYIDNKSLEYLFTQRELNMRQCR